MKHKILRLACWAALAAVFACMASGVRVNWLDYAMSATALAVLIMLLEFEERNSDSRMVALVGILVAVAVASRQILHGIEFSPVFFIIILCGSVFGPTPGFTVGALTMFTSNFFLGHGPWTPFQMFAMGLTGALAAYLPKARRLRMPFLLAYSVASAYMYGFLTDMFYWMAFVPAHSIESFAGVLAAGMPANTMRAAGNVFFMGIIGPVLLKVFDRFKARLTYRRGGKPVAA